MTQLELTQQIMELSQQQAMYTGCIPALILGFALLLCLGSVCVMSDGWSYLWMRKIHLNYRSLGIVLFALSIGCLIALGIAFGKESALNAQIEMLKYQLDNITPILPMN